MYDHKSRKTEKGTKDIFIKNNAKQNVKYKNQRLDLKKNVKSQISHKTKHRKLLS